MNILKPQRILFDKLTRIENLLDEMKENEKIDNIYLEDYKEENIEFNDITIEKSIIDNTDIINSNLEKILL